MNRAERRQNGIRAVRQTPKAKPQTFGLVPFTTSEATDADGNKLEITLFHVVTADGQQAVTHTPSGPVAIVIAGLPVITGRAVIARGSIIH